MAVWLSSTYPTATVATTFPFPPTWQAVTYSCPRLCPPCCLLLTSSPHQRPPGHRYVCGHSKIKYSRQFIVSSSERHLIRNQLISDERQHTSNTHENRGEEVGTDTDFRRVLDIGIYASKDKHVFSVKCAKDGFSRESCDVSSSSGNDDSPLASTSTTRKKSSCG